MVLELQDCNLNSNVLDRFMDDYLVCSPDGVFTINEINRKRFSRIAGTYDYYMDIRRRK